MRVTAIQDEVSVCVSDVEVLDIPCHHGINDPLEVYASVGSAFNSKELSRSNLPMPIIRSYRACGLGYPVRSGVMPSLRWLRSVAAAWWSLLVPSRCGRCA
ncbi:hypothetical protein N7468_006498 [Penicillium chermesinum]|uniref:Uncharacterized protein n=1 Tax=Penicillium chermesinum TaxID=63820 RepID=A0A9W9TJR0_9EURO|nr:uncharacterized protein N7468_006498 [Penicillium chermesinum]KAJ5225273.1 hypothetical protein N7468_006498 [Penicillium chermesinum]